MSGLVRLAVVGYGLVGKRHAAAIRQMPGVMIAAIVDPDPTAREAAERLGAFWYASLEDMFAAGGIDGVILATPTPLHVEQGLICIENGCATLVEKPIAVTSDEALQLVEAAATKGVPLLVGHHRRYNPIVLAAKEAIDRGAVGDIRAAQATCWFYKPDYYFDEASWRKKKGAGPISVNLVHDVDLLRHFCGEVTEVRAQSVPSKRGFENEDLAAAVLTFQSGALATISVSDSIVSPWSWELTAGENPAYPKTQESCYLIGGSEGAISIPDLRLWRHGGLPDWWSPISAEHVLADSLDPLCKQALHFAEVIRGQAEPVVSGLEGTRSLQVVEAIDRSAASGKPIALTPVDVGTLS